jgi:hypothetical protein
MERRTEYIFTNRTDQLQVAFLHILMLRAKVLHLLRFSIVLLLLPLVGWSQNISKANFCEIFTKLLLCVLQNFLRNFA